MRKRLVGKFSIILVAITLLISCANPNIGRVLPNGDYPEICQSCHHHIVYEHLILDYDCFFSDDKRSVTFDGDIQILKTGLSSGWEVTKLSFTVYFLDRWDKIVAVDYFSIWPNKAASEKIKFKQTFKYQPQYRSVVYNCKGRARL